MVTYPCSDLRSTQIRPRWPFLDESFQCVTNSAKLYCIIIACLLNMVMIEYMHVYIFGISHLNTLRPRQNGRHIADIFECNFLNGNVWISIRILLYFVPKGSIDNIPALVQIMAWRRPVDKPLSEPMMVSSLTHICATQPQWDNLYIARGSTPWIGKCHIPIALEHSAFDRGVVGSSPDWRDAIFHFITFRLFQEQLFSRNKCYYPCTVGISCVNFYKQIYIYREREIYWFFFKIQLTGTIVNFTTGEWYRFQNRI